MLKKLTSEIKSLKAGKKYQCKYCQKWDHPHWKCPRKPSSDQNEKSTHQKNNSNNVKADSEN
jgi:hypothetical protein